jgi:hypothetical protein
VKKNDFPAGFWEGWFFRQKRRIPNDFQRLVQASYKTAEVGPAMQQSIEFFEKNKEPRTKEPRTK